MITYSDSTQKVVQENVFCFYGNILNLVTKVAQTFPKSDQFFLQYADWEMSPICCPMAVFEVFEWVG